MSSTTNNQTNKYNVIKPSRVNLNNIVLSDPKPNQYGGKNVNFYHDKTILRMQLPIMCALCGVKENYNKDGLEISLAFRDSDLENPKIKNLFECLKKFDEFAIEKAIENSKKWFGRDKSRESLEDPDCYSPLIRYSKKEGSDFPPTLRIKIPQNKETKKYTFEIYDSKKKQIHINPVKDDENAEVFGLEDVIHKGALITAIVQVSSFWVGSGKFGISTRLIQLIVYSNRQVISGYIAQPDSEEEEDAETHGTDSDSDNENDTGAGVGKLDSNESETEVTFENEAVEKEKEPTKKSSVSSLTEAMAAL